MMKRAYDAIVVGGGLAGLTCAAFLTKNGLSTLLIEKSNKVGGLANSFFYEGFTFDSGIRAFENSGIILPMIKALGLDIKLVKNPVSIGINDQWQTLVSQTSINDYASLLKNFFPDNSKDIDAIITEIRKVMAQMDVIYGIDNPLFRENFSDQKYVFNTLLPWLIKYQKNIRKATRLSQPIYDYLRKFTDNQSLIDMIAQHFFKDTASFFALSYFSLYLDYSFPMGGTGVLASKIKDYILEHSGDLLLNSAVTSINLNKHQVLLSDRNEFCYRQLIWAGNQKQLYESISGPISKKARKVAKIIATSRGGDSVLSLFMGVDINPSICAQLTGPHAFFTPQTKGLSSVGSWQNRQDKSLEGSYEWVRNYLNKTTYEISIPVLRDASLAPEGKVGLIISAVFNYEVAQYFLANQKYQEFKEFCTKLIISLLEEKIFRGLKEKVIFALCSTPLTIEKETSNFQGAITGWAFNNPVMPSENRFKKIRKAVYTPFKDIWQCGAWTFSPSGLPVSILTGKVAADRVKKSLKPKKGVL